MLIRILFHPAQNIVRATLTAPLIFQLQPDEFCGENYQMLAKLVWLPTMFYARPTYRKLFLPKPEKCWPVGMVPILNRAPIWDAL